MFQNFHRKVIKGFLKNDVICNFFENGPDFDQKHGISKMFTHLSPLELSVKQLKDAGLPITDCRGCINLPWILMTQAFPKSMYFVNKKFLLSTKSKPRSISFQLSRYQHLKLEIFSKNISFKKPYGWQRVNNK